MRSPKPTHNTRRNHSRAANPVPYFTLSPPANAA